MKKILDYLYKYRYVIAICLFILCVTFKVSGSSIGLWDAQMNIDIKDNGLIFGESRPIRSDEWATLTPMFKSQIVGGFKYFNPNLRATPTDVFMIYATPVLSIFQIYRPFLFGFMLFGFERGLSFFWCGRFIVLFLVSLELFMIITKKNKLLSYIGASMVTLSPMMQWWFAVNGIAEIFIFGELAVILLYKYLNTDIFKKRLLYLFIMLICAGGYVLVIYPSWQVPMVYVFLALAIWVIIENRKNSKITKKDVVAILLTMVLFASSMLCILKTSSDTIKTVQETVYPGARFELGGGQIKKFMLYLSSFFFPFKQTGLGSSNVCEEALMFSMFPVGIILTIRNLIINKKKDILSICLLIAYIFLGTWCIVGFPRILAKITLLSNSQATRTVLAIGYLDILFFLRGIALNKKSIKLVNCILISIIISTILVFVNYKSLQDYYTFKPFVIVLAIMTIYLIFTSLIYDRKVGKILFTGGILFALFISGFLVNPLRTGANVIEESKLLKEVKKLDKDDTGIWISEGFNYPTNNYIAMAGVKTINVTNTYPDLEKWYKIDKDKKYEDVYNRYAHIRMDLVTDETVYENKFQLVQFDVFNVSITRLDLLKLDVKYIFTKNNLESLSDESMTFVKMYQHGDYKIYKILPIFYQYMNK